MPVRTVQAHIYPSQKVFVGFNNLWVRNFSDPEDVSLSFNGSWFLFLPRCWCTPWASSASCGSKFFSLIMCCVKKHILSAYFQSASWCSLVLVLEEVASSWFQCTLCACSAFSCVSSRLESQSRVVLRMKTPLSFVHPCCSSLTLFQFFSVPVEMERSRATHCSG